MKELQPCPNILCKSMNLKIRRNAMHSGDKLYYKYWIECLDCNATLIYNPINATTHKEAKSELVEQWNNRSID